jgi:hypothetical protein
MPMIVKELEDECEVNFEEHFEREEAKDADRDVVNQAEINSEIREEEIDVRLVESLEKCLVEDIIELELGKD